MKRSTQRILTTHTGSLPRPKKLLDLIMAGNMWRTKETPAFRPRCGRRSRTSCARKRGLE